MMASSLEEGFRTCLASFKKRLTDKEQHDFQFATLEDVHQEIARIQAEQGSRKEMMNMTRIQSFLEAMDQFGKVVEVFLNVSNFVAFIWGPLKFLLQVASTWADSFEILLDAYEQIGHQIPLLQQFQALFDYSPYMKELLLMIYSDIFEFHKGAIRFFSAPVWRQVFRSAWKDFKTRFQHILDSLRSHRELLESKANLLHFQQYKEHRLNTLAQLDRLEEAERQKKYISVLEWVSGPQTNLDHESACKARSGHPESGSWILKNTKLENWKDVKTPMSSTLWLTGIPGAGKTILASVIIEGCLQNESFATSFFYCKNSDPEKKSCNSILKGLLSQLICQSRDLIPYCHERYLASGELTLTSSKLIKQLLDVFCESIWRQYIIVDGLDECDITERKQILSFFTSMVDQYDTKEPGKVRVLFVSQDENDIRKAFPKDAAIVLGPTDNEDDIRSFVKTGAMKIKLKHELNNEQAKYIIDATCTRARGMFLFAKLVMSNLYAQPTRQRLREEMEASKFPQGLGQAYERIMSRIATRSSPAEWKIARKLLGWMICARRPLKWHEIQGAVSIDPVEQTVDFDERKLRVHIQDLCGSLIQILPGDRVELVHSTAKFYITDTGFVRTSVEECNLTTLCLQYLTFECFDHDISPDKLSYFAMKGYFAFLDYAVANWSRHFCTMVESARDLFPEGSDQVDTVKELGDAVNDFINNYEEELFQESGSGPSQKACEWFQHCDFYPGLQLVWSHVNRHQEKGFDARNDVSLKVLSNTLSRNRKLLEEITSSTPYPLDKRKEIDSFYGSKRFKCSKLTCFHFHEGFEDAKRRQLHIDRHNRPYRCTFPDCSVADFGFASSKDLEKHMKSYHPELADQAVSFVALKTTVGVQKWACHLCTKKFTRNLHLRSHIRNHNAERPFECSKCGKAFTRANDCRRHEEIHARK